MDFKNDKSERPAPDEQALWELLGRSRPVEVSPFFVRRVLRDLDAGETLPDEVSPGWRAWLRPAWILTGSTAALAVAVGLISFSSLTDRPLPAAVHRQAVPSVALAIPVPAAGLAAPAAPTAPAVSALPAVAAGPAKSSTAVADLGDVSSQDVDVIADLDNLVAREETSVWTDDTSRF